MRFRSSLFEPRRIGEMSAAGRVLVYGGLVFWTLVCLFPLYWVAITSLKLPGHVAQGPVYVPFVDFTPSLHAWHYITVEVGGDTLRPYVNSVVVSILSTGLAVLIGSMAAYALARLEFAPRLGSILLFVVLMIVAFVVVAAFGVDWRIAAAAAVAVFLLGLQPTGRVLKKSLTNADILFWVISQRIMPPVVAALPVYVMFQSLKMLDTRSALVATYMTVNLPIVVWLMYDFFVGIPRDLEESASLEGASRFGIFFTIALPLARPGLVATTLLVFILAWNEYLLALFLSNANAQTMPLLVAAQNATRGPQWWYMSVLISLMIVPVILLAVFLQRFIAKGMLLGAVKG